MNLKAPHGKAVQVHLESGHCLVVPPEGRDVPQMFVAEAMRHGCLPVELSAADVASNRQENQEKSKTELIENAVKAMLEEGCPLTNAGLPNLKELSKRVGFTVTAVELGEVWAKLEAEAKE